MPPDADGAAMPEASREAPVDYFRLAAFLSALGYPVRLELLDTLRLPRTLSQIKVSPQKTQGGSPERASARQTVRAHLQKLVEAGLVKAEPVEPGAKALRYTVNPQKLYALTEDIRRLSTMYAATAVAPDATGTIAAPSPRPAARGPRMVLVHGVYEGKSFALDPQTARSGQWIIGRKRGSAVTLDYDPYVSLENAAVSRRGSEFVLTDLPGSKNGASVNWERLPKGGSRPLRPADIVGVGRSLLSFALD